MPFESLFDLVTGGRTWDISFVVTCDEGGLRSLDGLGMTPFVGERTHPGHNDREDENERDRNLRSHRIAAGGARGVRRAAGMKHVTKTLEEAASQPKETCNQQHQRPEQAGLEHNYGFTQSGGEFPESRSRKQKPGREI